MGTHMFRQIIDASRKNRNLNFRRTGVISVFFMLFDNLVFSLFCDRHRLPNFLYNLFFSLLFRAFIHS